MRMKEINQIIIDYKQKWKYQIWINQVKLQEMNGLNIYV